MERGGERWREGEGVEGWEEIDHLGEGECVGGEAGERKRFEDERERCWRERRSEWSRERGR